MKLSSLLIMIILISSCKSKNTKYNLDIPRDKMKLIVLDLYLAGAAIELNPAKNKDSLKQLYFTEICKVHKVKDNEVSKSVEELHKNISLNLEIQREVLDSINRIRDKQYKIVQ
jgi:ribosomal protein S13